MLWLLLSQTGQQPDGVLPLLLRGVPGDFIHESCMQDAQGNVTVEGKHRASPSP